MKPAETMRRAPGELYELAQPLQDTRYTNQDLSPTRLEERTWSTYNVASLWIGMAVCIPTYMLAAGLVDKGMSWLQALVTILLGNLIVLVPMILIAHPGTRYGIPFPVLARSSFGVFGSNVPGLLRAGVACGWFGIQTWIGGTAIHSMLKVAIPDYEPPFAAALSFLAFWAINIYIVVRGSESIKFMEAWAAPFLLVSGLVLLGWAVSAAGGLGPVLSQPSRFGTTGEFLAFFFPALTGMVGFWSTLALNIPDISRYVRSQRSQALGQLLGLPTTMTLFAFIGVAVTSASVIILGEAVWDPVQLISRVGSPAVILMSMVALTVATLSTNVAANVIAPANGFANLFPKRITFAIGGIITGVIGILIMPWRLLATSETYIYDWLGVYAGLLGPVAGIFIADYWLIRNGRLSLPDLYDPNGIYGRVNGRAIAAYSVAAAVALVGRYYPPLRFLADNSWIVGFSIGFVIYVLTMRGTPQVDLSDVPEAEPPA